MVRPVAARLPQLVQAGAADHQRRVDLQAVGAEQRVLEEFLSVRSKISPVSAPMASSAGGSPALSPVGSLSMDSFSELCIDTQKKSIALMDQVLIGTCCHSAALHSTRNGVYFLIDGP